MAVHAKGCCFVASRTTLGVHSSFDGMEETEIWGMDQLIEGVLFLMAAGAALGLVATFAGVSILLGEFAVAVDKVLEVALGLQRAQILMTQEALTAQREIDFP